MATKRNKRDGRPFAERFQLMFDELPAGKFEEAIVPKMRGVRKDDELAIHPAPALAKGESFVVEPAGRGRVKIRRENNGTRPLQRRELGGAVRVR